MELHLVKLPSADLRSIGLDSAELRSMEFHSVELRSKELHSVKLRSAELRSNSNLNSLKTISSRKKTVKKGAKETKVWV